MDRQIAVKCQREISQTPNARTPSGTVDRVLCGLSRVVLFEDHVHYSGGMQVLRGRSLDR